MSIPKNGYYIALVQCDTGGENMMHVEVRNGIPLTRRGTALRPSACSKFEEVSTSEFCRVWYSDAAMELNALRTANKAFVEQSAATQAELDKSARILLETVNDRNRIGVQLDLIRDELLRIQARISETGLVEEHPGLSSIAGYCERAQKDIAVMYTPIEERDWLRVKFTTASNENTALVERVKRLEEAGEALRVALDGSWNGLKRCTDTQANGALVVWNKAKEAKP